MLKVLIPLNSDFCIFEQECRILYENSQSKIGDTNSFDFIRDNTFFFMFVNNSTFIGAIYYFIDEENKLFLNAFAKRKNHLINLKCLKMSLDWFDCDIYAQAQNRMSALCLRKCGFKKIGKNIYVFRKNQD